LPVQGVESQGGPDGRAKSGGMHDPQLIEAFRMGHLEAGGVLFERGESVLDVKLRRVPGVVCLQSTLRPVIGKRNRFRTHRAHLALAPEAM